MKKEARILIISTLSLIGKNFVPFLKERGFKNVFLLSAENFDLTRTDRVENFLKKLKPRYIFLTHLYSGGIKLNSEHPASLIYQNLQIQNAVIHGAHKTGVERLLYWASSCVYPRNAKQPMTEMQICTGKVEDSNEAYAIAKLAGIALCKAYHQEYRKHFFTLIPATVYGPADDFNPHTSHVIASFIQRFHQAKKQNLSTVILWGSGKPRREFIYIDDVLEASLLLLNRYTQNIPINVGVSRDVSIYDLAMLVRKVVGFTGSVAFDQTKPDGVFRKLLSSKRIRALGWKPRISLLEGIQKTYRWYKNQVEE